MDSPIPALAPPRASVADLLDTPQRAGLHLRLGHRRGIRATLRVTPTGMLAIGALVSSILLSSAVIVRAAQPGRVPGRGGR